MDGGNAKALAACLSIGDNFSLLAPQGNDEGVDFWILLCEKELHLVDRDCEDPQGQTFERGDMVSGRYYKQSGRQTSCYILTAERTLVYSHLVKVSKFKMGQAAHRQKGRAVFSLSNIEHSMLYLQFV